MGFEQNRQELLKNLSKVKREKNVAKKAAAINREKTAALRSTALENVKERETIIIFGIENFFIRSITNSLKLNYTVRPFDDAGKACDYCIDNSVNYVFLDMDEPTDWRQSTDVFTTVKTINPAIRFFMFTSRSMDKDVRTLEAQGAIIMNKPVSLEDIRGYIS